MNALRIIMDRKELKNIAIPENFGLKVEVVILPAMTDAINKKNNKFNPKEYMGITKIKDITAKLKELSGERDRF